MTGLASSNRALAEWLRTNRWKLENLALREQVEDLKRQRDHLQEQYDRIVHAMAYRQFGRRVDGDSKVPEMTAPQAIHSKPTARDRQREGVKSFEEQLQKLADEAVEIV